MHFCFACVYSLIMWAGVSLGVFWDYKKILSIYYITYVFITIFVFEKN